MAFSLNEQHAMSLLTPHLEPNERILYRSRGVEKPWYSRIFSRFGSLFWRNYLVAATERRVLFLQHAGLLGGFKMKAVDALAWSEVDRAQLGWGVFNKNLSVQSQARGFKKTVTLGRFWMKDNFPAAEGMVETWNRSKAALPAGQTAGALPQRAAYG